MEEKALGVYWNMEEDYLGYRTQSMSKPLTKRGLVSMLRSIYDPMGLATTDRPGPVQRQDRLGRENQHEPSGTVDMMGEWTGRDGGGQDLEVHPPPEPHYTAAASLLGRLRESVWSGVLPKESRPRREDVLAYLIVMAKSALPP